MADSEHNPSGQEVGVFTKIDSPAYRKNCEGCGRGYHGNRWDAHHILPGVCFSMITDSFVWVCLNATDWDFIASYSMAGLPKLTAFILSLQKDSSIPYTRALELTVTMRRWGTVSQYDNQKHISIGYPGNFPVHNPCNWGHTIYNENVYKRIEDEIINLLNKKKKKQKHLKPESVRTQIETIMKAFWADLVARGSGPGGGGCVGTKENLQHRYGKAKNGWWKPLCMADLSHPPQSPSIA